MKKILLLLIIFAGTTHSKAQQANIAFDQNLFKTPKDQNLLQVKPGDSTLFKNFSVWPTQQGLTLVPNELSGNSLFSMNPAAEIDHMPIAKLEGSIDHMPIAKISGNIDNMPILKVPLLAQPLQPAP